MAKAEFSVGRRSRQEKRQTLLAKKVDEVGQWSELEARPKQENEFATNTKDSQRHVGGESPRDSQEESLKVAAFEVDTRKLEEGVTSDSSSEDQDENEKDSDINFRARSRFAKAEESSHENAHRNSILKTPLDKIGQPAPEDATQRGEDKSDEQSENDSSAKSLFAKAEEASHLKARRSSLLKNSHDKIGQLPPADATQSAEQQIASITQKTQGNEDSQEKRRQLQGSMPERLGADEAWGYKEMEARTKPSQLETVRDEFPSTRHQDPQAVDVDFGSFAAPCFRDDEVRWKVEVLMNDVINGGSLNSFAEGLAVFDNQECKIVAQVLLSRVAKNAQSCKTYAKFVSRMAHDFPSVAGDRGHVVAQTFLTAVRQTCWSEFSQLIEILSASPTRRLLYHTQTYGILGFIAELFNLRLIPVEYVEDVAQAILEMSLLPPASENFIGCMCDFLQLTFRILPKVTGGPDFVLRMSKQLRGLSITKLPVQARVQIEQLLHELAKLDNVAGRFAPIASLSQPISWASLDAV